MARPAARSPDTACAVSRFSPSIAAAGSAAIDLGEFQRARHQLLGIDDLVDQAGVDEFGGGHDGAGHQQQIGAVAAELGDAALRAAAAGDQPELDLRQAEFARTGWR